MTTTQTSLEVESKKYDFDDSGSEFAEITFKDKNAYYVQLTDSQYRSDLNCLIYLNNEEFNNDELQDQCNAAIDIAEELALNFQRDNYEYIDSKFNASYANQRVVIRFNKIDKTAAVVIDDSQPGSYETRYTCAKEFDSLEDAKEFVRSFDTDEHYDVNAVFNCINALRER